MKKFLTLPAHFDGVNIRLDEPYTLTPDTKLLVTILPSTFTDDEDDGWRAVSIKGLAGAYGEEEPDYSSNLLKETNPDYEGM